MKREALLCLVIGLLTLVIYSCLLGQFAVGNTTQIEKHSVMEDIVITDQYLHTLIVCALVIIVTSTKASIVLSVCLFVY